MVPVKDNGQTFYLELNLISKAWKPYGVDLSFKAPGLKKTN